MALVDCTSEDPKDLRFKRGTLIEGVEVYTHQNIRIFNGRVRGSQGRIPADSIILINNAQHEKVLEQYSSRKLFDKASENGWEFIQVLFAEREDNLNQPQLTVANTSLKTSYVDWNGQLHDQALHFAVIAEDYEMIRFLTEMGVDINKSANFPALFSKHPTDDPVSWEPYVSQRLGPPLTAAVNRYVRSKHTNQEVSQKAEIVSWRKMIQELIKQGAKWAEFADGEELLGHQSAFRADAPSVLWRAIDYDDRAIYDLILNAKPPLDFAWLPWKPFFESTQWWIPFKSPVRSLKGDEARGVIELLRNHPNLAVANAEETLKSSIARVIWGEIQKLQLSAPRINTLFEQLMAQIGAWHSCESERQQKEVVQQLETVLRANPDVESWVKETKYRSVLHFCVAENLHDPLEVFLIDGKSTAYINLPFEDGEGLLDKTISHGDNEMFKLLRRHKAQPAHPMRKDYLPTGSITSLSLRRSSNSRQVRGASVKRIQTPSRSTTPFQGPTTQSLARQLLPLSPGIPTVENGGLCPGDARTTRVSSITRAIYKASLAAAQATPESQERCVDFSHDSDSEFQFGSNTVESPATFETSETAHAAPSGLSATGLVSPPICQGNYADALKLGLSPNMQWSPPTINTRPKLTTRNSTFKAGESRKTEIPSLVERGYRGRGSSTLSRGRVRGRSRGRGRG